MVLVNHLEQQRHFNENIEKIWLFYHGHFQRTNATLVLAIFYPNYNQITLAVFTIGDCFVALLVGTFTLITPYRLEKNLFMVKSLITIFLSSIIFMRLFAASKVPFINQLHIPYRGLWQQANLFFLYLPFLLIVLNDRNR